MSMIFGYARVSTEEQNLDMQVDALKKAGCERIFEERMSGAKNDRPILAQALENLRPGDTLVVWRLDRLGRSLKHLLAVVEGLADRGVNFKSITEAMDTATPGGRFIFQVFGAIAEFERNLIRERTMEGLKSARARGRKGGRPKSLTKAQIEVGRTLAQNSELSVEAICDQLKISKATYYRHIMPRPSKP